MNEILVTLASIGDGAALELFDRELARVIGNIADPNTSPTQTREINIKIKIKPDEDRDIGEAQVLVSAKLASVKPVKSTLYFGKKEGRLIAVENNPKQSTIFDTPETKAARANITPLSQVRQAQGD